MGNTKVITPIRPDELEKADEIQAPIVDVTMRVTCVRAMHTDPARSRRSRDGVAAYLSEEVLNELRGLIPDAEVARYPDDKTTGVFAPDPDFPGDPMLPAFQSMMSSDIFLLATTTSPYGYAVPASKFSEKLEEVIQQFGNRITESGKVAAVVVVGGSGALDLASCLLYQLNDYGFIIPGHGAVVYDDGTEKRGDATVIRSRSVREQMERLATSIVRMAKRLKGEELP